MTLSSTTLRARARRAPLFAPLAIALILSGHAGTAGANWFDQDFTPPVEGYWCGIFENYRISRPMGFVRSDGINSIVYAADLVYADGSHGGSSIFEFSQLPNSGQWQFTNLTAAAGGPDGVNPMAYVRGDGLSTVLHTNGVDHHIHELALFNGTWSHTDVSAAAVPPGLPMSGWGSTQFWGYVRGDGITTIVYVADADRHVHELARVAGQWHDADLSVAAGDPSNVDSSLHAYVQADGTSAVVYRGQDGKVRELELHAGKWHVNAIGFQAGQPVSGATPMGYVRADGINAVVYLGADQHIHELSQVKSKVKGFVWVDTDLTTTAWAPYSYGAPWAFVREDHVSAVVYSDAWTNPRNLHQLALVNGHWKDTNITVAAGASFGGSYFTTAFVDNHKQTVVPRCPDDDVYGRIATMRDGLLPP